MFHQPAEHFISFSFQHPLPEQACLLEHSAGSHYFQYPTSWRPYPYESQKKVPHNSSSLTHARMLGDLNLIHKTVVAVSSWFQQLLSIRREYLLCILSYVQPLSTVSQSFRCSPKPILDKNTEIIYSKQFGHYLLSELINTHCKMKCLWKGLRTLEINMLKTIWQQDKLIKWY